MSLYKKLPLLRRYAFIWHLFFAAVKVYINPLFPRRWQHILAEKRVIREIRRAYRNVPYYRQTYDEAGIDIRTIRRLDDIKKLPLITKEEIRANFPEGMVARGVNIDRCRLATTTGSTGKPLTFIFSPSTSAFYLATIMRVYAMMGYRPWHKISHIKYAPLYISPGRRLFRRAHIPSTLSVEEQISLLKKQQPDLIVGYASTIFDLARNVTRDDTKHIRPKFISINSEMSTRDERDFISRVFGSPVFDEYSTEETWMIASQCRHQNYHLFIDNVWVEFLDEKGNDVADGEVGEIVLTTMRSPAMPFIRYKIGDLGSTSGRVCACGCGFPLMESFEGRSDASIILPSGRILLPYRVLNCFLPIITQNPHLVDEFRIVQKERDLLVVQIVKGRKFKDSLFQKTIENLKTALCEPLTVLVEEVLPTKDLKREAIESRVSKKHVCRG